MAKLAQLVQFLTAQGDQLVFVEEFLGSDNGILWFQGHGMKTGLGEQGNGLQPTLQAGLDECIQVAIQHCLGIAGFDTGTQILDA